MHTLFNWYDKLVLRHPKLWLLLIAAVSVFAAWQARDFRLDASADSLVLEHDQALAYYRTISKRYGGSDFLIATFTPHDHPLFSRPALKRLGELRDDLAKVQGVKSVYSMLDVPLLFSPKVAFSDLSKDYRTLRDPGVNLDMAKQEFTTKNPLYRKLLVSPDGQTTAILINLQRDEHYYDLLHRRNELRNEEEQGKLSEAGEKKLKRVENTFYHYKDQVQKRTAKRIKDVRQVLNRYRGDNSIFLGGIPMIASDMIRFISSDLKTFGVGVLAFLTLTLLIIFRRPRWVVIPLLCCAAAVLWVTGWLGWVDWSVTVISSNFISLLLIITMSTTIHLIVRYRELHEENPHAHQNWLVRETVRHMARPSIYTVLTTMVAFTSLVVSDIRPVIAFGWMMTVGIAIALFLSFTLFPAALLPLSPGAPRHSRDYTKRFTLGFAHFTHRHTRLLLILMVVVAAVALFGTTRLSVENRFIDYFQKNTEIYKGMVEIDRKLGGTTPLDIILDAPKSFKQQQKAKQSGDGFDNSFDGSGSSGGGDGFSDPFSDNTSQQSRYQGGYWYTPQHLEKLVKIQNYLDSLPDTGKVLSVGTTYEVAKKLNGGPLSYVKLMLLSNLIPDNLKDKLLDPYIAEGGNQVRILVRVIDSDKHLKRNVLLHKIKNDLQQKFGLSPDQVHLTGAMVLYNNMLQSLFNSQIKTLGFVFLAIMTMFFILFRSLPVALIAMTPNLFSAACILGLMGWIGLPLDMMTITIAAITIGIAVDDTIHYIHRFREEFPKDRDYLATMRRCHGSIGKAMYYTSLTIIAGFSILAMSKFNPTVYFGLLTGLAMFIALIANLTLLPALLVTIRPKVPVMEE